MGRPRALPEDILELIRHGRANGKSYATIATELGKRESTIWETCQRYAIVAPHVRTGDDAQREANAKARVEAAKAWAERTAAGLDRSRGGVLEAGSPLTWDLLIAGTVLEGAPYPDPRPMLARAA
jgi:hypothetical protein